MELSGNDKGDDQNGECLYATAATTITATTATHLQYWSKIWTKSKDGTCLHAQYSQIYVSRTYIQENV